MRHREKPAAASATVPPVMDINKWLADTAEAVGPTKRTHRPGSPGRATHPRTAPVIDSQSSGERRAKNHQDGSRDSSIIAPEHVPTEVAARRMVRYAHQASVEDLPSERAAAAHTSQYENDNSENGANPYQRKKRHKTKADRYALKLQERENCAEDQHDEKQKRRGARKNKETKRSRKDKSAPVMVRNFHAANVPRERLTLQPQANVGIFKRGKASSPFRGRGLPDLAFSEMNFLSKRKYAAEEVAETEETSKRRRRGGKRATEEEISSYFAPKKPLLAEKLPKGATHRESMSRDAIEQFGGVQRRSSTVPSIRPTTEKPVPGELEDRKSGSRSISNTYFTWSDSLRHSDRAAIARPVSTTDLEAYRVTSIFTPSTGKKMRASSHDLNPPNLMEHRQFMRSQTTRDHKRDFARSNSNNLNGDATTSPSLPHLNQIKGTNLERVASRAVDFPCTGQGSPRSIDSLSLPMKNISPPRAAHLQKSIILKDSIIVQAEESTPVLQSQKQVSASIANLLDDCDNAYRTIQKVHVPRVQPAQHDHRPKSESANEQSSHEHHSLRENNGEVDDADMLFNEQDDLLSTSKGPQSQVLRMLEEQCSTYESEDGEETLDYLHPPAMRYDDQVQLAQPIMPTRCPTSDPEDGDEEDEEEEQALQQVGVLEEVEDDDGLAGFWKPNMLY
ncbi:hypothetical protein FKW77_008184 [Venturia effusa]|uniref:Uncharacterized protein n=1 Tax=Venturia effusa TaxID=50376 RepID=A0A517LBC3_9PEZI|nr:hypothetical protein FKW77_008184 [Venturia effusa]